MPLKAAIFSQMLNPPYSDLPFFLAMLQSFLFLPAASVSKSPKTVFFSLSELFTRERPVHQFPFQSFFSEGRKMHLFL